MTAPEPTARDLGCWFHGDEPIPDGAYLVCGECGHCYVTAADLIEAERRLYPDLPARTSAAQMWSCPLCAHDF